MRKIAMFLCPILIASFLTACAPSVSEPVTPPQEVQVQETQSSQQQNIALTDVAYEGTTLFGFPVVRFEVSKQLEVDLDRCGAPEIVALLQIFDTEDQSSYALRVIKGDKVYDTDYLYSWGDTILVEDLNSDGQPEIYTYGDMMSSDFVTYGWKLTESGLQSLSPDVKGALTGGSIRSVENGIMTIEEYQYVLGTWPATRPFVSSDIHGIEPMNSTVWELDSHFRLSVIAPLPVSTGGTEVLLPAGTQLDLTAFDGENTVWFKTTDGLEGTIEVQHVNGMIDGTYAMWSIDRRSENYYFEILPYAG